jgi:hypothetical protein
MKFELLRKDMIEVFELLLIGLLAGILSAFFGVGGGIIMVPLLSILLPELPFHFIIATSLSVIFFNALFNSIRFSKKINYEFKQIAIVVFSILLFTSLSSKFASSLNEFYLKLIFAASLSILTVWINIPKKETLGKTNKSMFSVLIGFISGGISGLTGLGGGAFNVPLLHIWLKIPFRESSAYSNLIMIFTASAACITFMLQESPAIEMTHIGFVIPKLCFAMVIASFFGSKIGIILHQKVDEKKLKLYFSLLLILIIIRTLLSATGSI